MIQRLAKRYFLRALNLRKSACTAIEALSFFKDRAYTRDNFPRMRLWHLITQARTFLYLRRSLRPTQRDCTRTAILFRMVKRAACKSSNASCLKKTRVFPTAQRTRVPVSVFFDRGTTFS